MAFTFELTVFLKKTVLYWALCCFFVYAFLVFFCFCLFCNQQHLKLRS